MAEEILPAKNDQREIISNKRVPLVIFLASAIRIPLHFDIFQIEICRRKSYQRKSCRRKSCYGNWLREIISKKRDFHWLYFLR